MTIVERLFFMLITLPLGPNPLSKVFKMKLRILVQEKNSGW